MLAYTPPLSHTLPPYLTHPPSPLTHPPSLSHTPSLPSHTPSLPISHTLPPLSHTLPPYLTHNHAALKRESCRASPTYKNNFLNHRLDCFLRDANWRSNVSRGTNVTRRSSSRNSEQLSPSNGLLILHRQKN